MMSHEFARQLLAGPDLPLAFPTTIVGSDNTIAPPIVAKITLSIGDSLVDCLLIEPEETDDLDFDDDGSGGWKDIPSVYGG